MKRLVEGIVRGGYAGKLADIAMRDKINEIVDWINEQRSDEIESKQIKNNGLAKWPQKTIKK